MTTVMLYILFDNMKYIRKDTTKTALSSVTAVFSILKNTNHILKCFCQIWLKFAHYEMVLEKNLKIKFTDGQTDGEQHMIGQPSHDQDSVQTVTSDH